MRGHRHDLLSLPNLVLAGVALLSLAIWLFAGLGSFGACVRGTVLEPQQKTVAALDGTIALSIQISTGLTGVGAAALIGLKSGITLTPAVRALLLVSVLMFAQSALCASWWRFGVAEAWLNECLNIVAESYLHNRFQAHALFFAAGLISLGLLVIASARAARAEVVEG
jgi:hypothetical protein